MSPFEPPAAEIAPLSHQSGPEVGSGPRDGSDEWPGAEGDTHHVGGPRTDNGPPEAEVEGRTRPWRTYLSAGGAYLAVSVVLWWHVLRQPGTVTTCGCGDAALTLWVLKWPAYALSHGLNPFYSSKLFFPHGINMAPNSLGLGIAAAPVTWLFGPVASLNVIDVLSPPLSALAMFWLLRRWVRRGPAAFVGGLLFGFSPFVLVSLALAHPNFGLLVPVPLIIGCFDDLLVRRRFPPLAVGVVLGLLVTAEFLISVEVLLLVALTTLMSGLVVGGWYLLVHRDELRRLVRLAGPAVGVAAGVSAVLLAYPVWFFFAGPAHLVGRAWPDSPSGSVDNTPGTFVHGEISPALTGVMHAFGGYQGPTLPLLGYLGIGVIGVVAVGSVLWRRDKLIQFFGVIGLAAALCSLGVGGGRWAPWRLFTHLPVLNNVVPVNISVIVDTCAAIVLARVVEHAWSAVGSRAGPRWATVAGVSVAVAAIVPATVAFWPNVPMTVRPVVVPPWFASTNRAATARQVVLPYPAALGGIQSSMAWQAVGGLRFSMVGGGGPGITPSRAGSETPGFEILARASLPLGLAPTPDATTLLAVRRALAGWGVTTVVVPDQPSTPSYDRGRSVPYAVGFFTAALGTPPRHQSGAWVWDDVAASGPAAPVDPKAFSICIEGTGSHATGQAIADCVLRSR